MWIEVCQVDDIEPDDVLGFEHGGEAYAIVRGPADEFYGLAGYCTHEREPLCGGLVQDGEIECPRHMGRFDYATGAAKAAPVLTDLATHPVKVAGGRVYLEVTP